MDSFEQFDRLDDFEQDIISLMLDIPDFADDNGYLPLEMMEELAFYLDVYLTEVDDGEVAY